MDPDCSRREVPIFNLFTKESLTRIERRIADAKTAKENAKEREKEEGTEGKDNECSATSLAKGVKFIVCI